MTGGMRIAMSGGKSTPKTVAGIIGMKDQTPDASLPMLALPTAWTT